MPTPVTMFTVFPESKTFQVQRYGLLLARGKYEVTAGPLVPNPSNIRVEWIGAGIDVHNAEFLINAVRNAVLFAIYI